MKAKFVSTTNRLFESVEGAIGELSIGMVCYFDYSSDKEAMGRAPFELRHGTMRTSSNQNIKFTEVSLFCYEIEIQTKNSVYVFEVGERSDKKPLTREEELGIALAVGLF